MILCEHQCQVSNDLRWGVRTEYLSLEGQSDGLTSEEWRRVHENVIHCGNTQKEKLLRRVL